jgi:hypothetical protein
VAEERGMKISFLGNFSVSYCSEVQYASEMETLGHTVDRLQESRVSGQDVLRAALQSDVFVWVHSHGSETPGKPMDEVLLELRDHGIPTVAFHLDLYMPLARWKEYENSPYFKVEHFFTVDKLMADWLNENTETKGHFLPAGAFSKQCYLADYDPSLASDVVFIGSKGYHSEWSYRPTLINWLGQTYGGRFAHWGGDGRGLAREDKMNLVYGASRIAIGDTLCVGFDYPYYQSDRLFNICAAGALAITPYITGLEDLYVIDREVVTYEFGNWDQLRSKIDYYLANPAERNDIRIAGYLRTKQDHTYLRRWETILETVKHGA